MSVEAGNWLRGRVKHLNTPRLVADATGTTVWRWDQQEPFGDSPANENPSGAGTFDLPLRLPGQYYDAESGLHYNYFRDYDPGLGSYKQSDPIGLGGGLNTYGYTFGDPLRITDTNGEMGQLVIAAGIVIAGYGVWKLITIGTNVAKFKQATAMVATSQNALNAAAKACESYPQGGACYAIPALQRQVYQCRVTQVRYGTSILYGDPTSSLPRKPIMPGDKLFLR